MLSYVLNKSGKYSYLRVSVYCDDGRALKDIGAATPEEHELKNYNRKVKRNIADIETAIEKFKDSCSIRREPFLKKDVEDIIAGILGNKTGKGMPISDAIDKYCGLLRTGEMLREKGSRASEATIYALENANKFIRKHTDLANIGLDTFSPAHFKKLHQAFNTCKTRENKTGLSKNTAHNYNTAIRLFLKFTYKIWHKNRVFEDKELIIGAEDVDYGIFYKVPEIMALYKLKLTGFEELARDMFVYGCYTGMRVGDHNRHTSKNIQGDYILTNTKKKSNSTAIPIHPVVREILNKYKGEPPHMIDAVFNRIIKNVCEKATDEKGNYLFHDLVILNRTDGGKPMTYQYKRYELTSSHTMRRSFRTNARLSNVPREDVKRIGGWKSDKAFNKYDKATNMEVAESAAKHPFFSGETA